MIRSIKKTTEKNLWEKNYTLGPKTCPAYLQRAIIEKSMRVKNIVSIHKSVIVN